GIWGSVRNSVAQAAAPHAPPRRRTPTGSRGHCVRASAGCDRARHRCRSRRSTGSGYKAQGMHRTYEQRAGDPCMHGQRHWLL
ncbi:hypothetical protein IWW52_006691, partial [Coemansia sp. RSA 2704]